MNEWTVIKMMLDDCSDFALLQWEALARDWAGSRRAGKSALGKRLSKAVAREIKLRGGE